MVSMAALLETVPKRRNAEWLDCDVVLTKKTVGREEAEFGSETDYLRPVIASVFVPGQSLVATQYSFTRRYHLWSVQAQAVDSYHFAPHAHCLSNETKP